MTPSRPGLVALLSSLCLLGACATPPAVTGDAGARAASAASAADAAALPAPAAPAGPTVAAAIVPAALPAPAAVLPVDAAPIAVDALQPAKRVDLDDAAARSDLWARVRRGMAIADLDNDLVRKWEQWYASRPDYVARMTERGGRYLFHIFEEVNKRGLPGELALLPFIESAFNPQAMSTAKASGMWQFVPGTGRDFDLRQNVFRDDRRDVLASTRAALDYLQSLNAMFGDWRLALAAYNWGQGNVQRAITRNQKAGLPTDYDSLRMPDETRNYLPKLQAVENIVMQPAAFALSLPPLQNHPGFISVALNADIDLDRAAKMAGLTIEEFKQLNPQMNKPVILQSLTGQVLLPYDNANRFVHALMRHQGPLASWTAWKVPRTMKPAEAAQQVGMSEAQLRELNGIPPRMLVKAGSTLLVPRDARIGQDVAVDIADKAMLALAPDQPPTKALHFKAGKKGDTVAAVARRYRSSPAQVAQWNASTVDGHFRPGQLITVMVPNRPAAKSARAQPPTRATVGRRSVKPVPTARSRAPQN